MMANLRKYVPKSQLSKVVTVKELEDDKKDPECPSEFRHACGQCKALQEQPIDMCGWCSASLYQTCRPNDGETKCPVCDGCFLAKGPEAPLVGRV